MLRNKIKQDFHITTLKGLKIIKLQTCDKFTIQKSNILFIMSNNETCYKEENTVKHITGSKLASLSTLFGALW